MHYFGHTIDNGVKFLYFVRSLLPSKSPILTKYWWVPLVPVDDWPGTRIFFTGTHPP